MPLRTRKNQYLGVNAHLHSYWQAENEWNDFHNPHIGDLSRGLRAQLLPLGYTTRVEQSVQIRRVGDDLRSPRADIIVRDLQPTQRPAFVPLTALAEYALVDVLPNLIDHEHPYMALVVYEIDLPKDKPVAWIELLSPSNKARGRDRRKYLHKRKLLLEGGAVFVEIDYLHQTPPTFLNFGDYSDRTQRDHAQPYRIFVLDPRPNLQTGAAYPYEFAVDQPIPTVTIPLNGTDRIDFDFGVVYRKTFEEMLYGLESVDYAAYPVNFDSYSAADQARIAKRMLAVLEAGAAEVDLEAGAPLAVGDAEGAEAQRRIAALIAPGAGG